MERAEAVETEVARARGQARVSSRPRRRRSPPRGTPSSPSSRPRRRRRRGHGLTSSPALARTWSALYDKIRASSGGLGAAALRQRRCDGLPARAQPRRHQPDPGGRRRRGAALRGVPAHPRAHVRVRPLSAMADAGLVVEADGGSRGNPGRPGTAPLVRDAATGSVLAERAASLGIATQQRRGVLRADRRACRPRSAIDPAADVEVRMDSKLVVEQMSGRWKIKHDDMRRLALEARDVVAATSAPAAARCAFTWMPREQNNDRGRPRQPAHGRRDHLRRRTSTETRRRQRRRGCRRGDRPRRLARPRPPPSAWARTSAAPPASSWCGTASPTSPSTARWTAAVAPTPPQRSSADRRPPRPPARVRAFLGDGPVRRGVLLPGARRTDRVGRRLGDWASTLETDDDWDEQCFGDWDGKSVGQLAARYPDELARLRDDDTYARVGGESHRDMAKRVLAALERARRQRHAGGRRDAPQADHGRPRARPAASRTTGSGGWRRHPASLTTIEVWSDGGAMVPFVNDTSHLR